MQLKSGGAVVSAANAYGLENMGDGERDTSVYEEEGGILGGSLLYLDFDDFKVEATVKPGENFAIEIADFCVHEFKRMYRKLGLAGDH